MKNSIAKIAQSLINEYLTKDDIFVDATCGNGNDTLFLAPLVKHVYAFDIQEKALNNAKSLCMNYSNITYINDSHENIFSYIKEAKGYLFNLGYLPGGSKHITTKVTSTINAITAIFNHMHKDDFLLVTVYHHEEGQKEAAAITSLFASLASNKYDIFRTSLLFKKKMTPDIYLVIKTTN